MVDYIALSIPIFFLLIGVEIAYTIYKKLKYYSFNDSIANLSQGIGSQLVGIFLKAATFFAYLYIFEHWRIHSFPNTFLTWLLLFLGVDFCYYWFHRMSHEVNALWAAHIVHHQSEEYNLTVALRQSWFQGGFSWAFYLPLAFFGFEPVMFLTVSSFNTLYQFWIHTRIIGKMNPVLEYIFNTPSHHRVHHGTNKKYIDKNHAGSLIIWDRMFGTFQAEEEEVVYGITKPLNSLNPFWANFHYWNELIALSARTPSLKNKFLVFFQPPGWLPGELSNQPLYTEENLQHKRYSPQNSLRLNSYLVVQFLLSLALATMLLFFNAQLSFIQLLSATLLILFTLTTCGALFEQQKWLQRFEYFRLSFWLITTYIFSDLAINNFYLYFSVLACIVSAMWFYTIKTKTENV